MAVYQEFTIDQGSDATIELHLVDKNGAAKDLTGHTVTMGGTNNPVSGSSVAAGGSLTGTRNSEDGSYNITATLPNTDGGGNPLAIHDLNKGTALLDSSQHTGITSVKGF